MYFWASILLLHSLFLDRTLLKYRFYWISVKVSRKLCYWVDDQGIGVRYSAEADISLLPTVYRLTLEPRQCPLNWTRINFFSGDEIGAWSYYVNLDLRPKMHRNRLPLTVISHIVVLKFIRRNFAQQSISQMREINVLIDVLLLLLLLLLR
jgi:hypothetical protein